MIRAFFAPAVFLIATSLAVAGCSRPAPPRTNLLLIVVDSLRADRLGCYGTRRPTSPAIDALAASGVRFKRAYATAPWTQPSVASLLTAQFPTGHGLKRLGERLPDALPTLATVLSERGYQTGAVVSHMLLGRRFGFARGFEHFDESEGKGHRHLSTQGVTDKAEALLQRFARDERPFFLLVHYFDPHYSYMRHPEIGFARPGKGRVQGGETLDQMVGMLTSMTKPELTALRSIYDEEVRFTDGGIGELLRALQQAGLDDQTLVAFTADHGEELVDHGFVGHTRSLYDELTRVPLILRLPRGEGAGRVIDAPVSMAALAPTLLELLGEASGSLESQSPSFATAVRGGPAIAQPILSEVDYIDWVPGADPSQMPRILDATRKTSIVSGRFKLVRDHQSGQSELYDLAADRFEEHNLASSQPGRLAELEAALDRETARLGGSDPEEGEAGERGEVELGPEDIEALRALGYVGG